MNEILDRYLELNEHAASYTWKRLGRPLDMDKTMEENAKRTLNVASHLRGPSGGAGKYDPATGGFR